MARGLHELWSTRRNAMVTMQGLPHAITTHTAARAAPPTSGLRLFGGDGFNFGDLIDLVNPLQHIPVLGDIYRKMTGDTIAPAMQIAGGALFGGPFGAAFAAAGVVVRGVIESAGDNAPAVTPDTLEPRIAPGGWMVAASRSFAPATSAPAAQEAIAGNVAPASARRGGWMVQAAYAMADERTREDRIDTLA